MKLLIAVMVSLVLSACGKSVDPKPVDETNMGGQANPNARDGKPVPPASVPGGVDESNPSRR